VRHQRVTGRVAHQVGLKGDGPPAAPCDLGNDGLGRLRRAVVVNAHRPAIGSQIECDGAPDPPAGAGNQGDPGAWCRHALTIVAFGSARKVALLHHRRWHLYLRKQTIAEVGRLESYDPARTYLDFSDIPIADSAAPPLQTRSTACMRSKEDIVRRMSAC